ncbi:MAG TPA: GTP cyclohydrolase I FolE2, partial [Thermotoga sp.]|nr:GTP cyclohydrolase I FolE2 [Thermotoga sp.]
MKDVQSERDTRKVPLKKVGISDLSWPVKVLDKERGYQYTVASMRISVDLRHDVRGTHMSRFIEALENLEMISPKTLEKA